MRRKNLNRKQFRQHQQDNSQYASGGTAGGQSQSDYFRQLVELENKIVNEKNNLLKSAGLPDFTDGLMSTIKKSNEKVNKQIFDFIDNRPSGENRKSLLDDPMDFNVAFGYKNRATNMSYDLLRGMVMKTPVINGIIRTRKEQVANFLVPQTNKYETGFIIRKKPKYYFGDDNSTSNRQDERLSKDDIKVVNYITDFILNCGANGSWEADDFDGFGRKWVDDSLTFDQAAFEVSRNRKNVPTSYFAVDASTIRIADSYDDEEFAREKGNQVSMMDYNRNTLRTNKYGMDASKAIKGYYPSYVQVYNGATYAEFYPWELSFSTRNPVTTLQNNGYGVSELEVLVNTITAMLWSEEYNRKFFSQGSAPKGFLKIKPTIGLEPSKLEEFKQSWRMMISGVQNAHKTPILEADADWIDLQGKSRDMEFVHWHEFLIRISCMMFCIDPSEIGFNLGNMSGQRAMFEGNNEASIKHSQDKGLKPLLRKLQAALNKHVVSQIHPDYELLFVGLEGGSENEELEADIKKLSNFMTVNEIRVKQGLKKLSKDAGGDLILNSIFYQNAMAQQQAKQQEEQEQQQQQGGQEYEDDGEDQQSQEGDQGQENQEDEGQDQPQAEVKPQQEDDEKYSIPID